MLGLLSSGFGAESPGQRPAPEAWWSAVAGGGPETCSGLCHPAGPPYPNTKRRREPQNWLEVVRMTCMSDNFGTTQGGKVLAGQPIGWLVGFDHLSTRKSCAAMGKLRMEWAVWAGPSASHGQRARGRRNRTRARTTSFESQQLHPPTAGAQGCPRCACTCVPLTRDPRP